MCFRSVLLPQPEPPRITKTSPRRTSKLTFSSRMKSPYPAVRPSTRMIGGSAESFTSAAGSSQGANYSPSGGSEAAKLRAWGSSYIQEEIDDGEDAVNNNEQDDARNDRPRCGIAHSGSAGRRLQAAQAADAGDQDREHERFDETGHEVREVDDALDLVNERHERNRE